MKNKLLLLYIFIFLGPLISSATCPGDTASFTTTAGACKNKVITFTNTSLGATTYFWDFGDGTTLSDTSHSANPSWTYQVLGNYTATLIVEKGTGCADTFTAIVNMSFIDALFTTNAPGVPKCISDSVYFTDTSTVGPGGTITNWEWNFGDTGSGLNDTSTSQNPSHLFSNGNQTFSVELITTTSAGCKDTATLGVGIQKLVIANAGTDITSCDNNLTVNLSGSILNAGAKQWIGTGGFSNPSSLTPIYTPTAAAKASGTDTIMLFAFSGTVCPNDTDKVVIFFNPGPTVNAGPDVSVCKDTSGVPLLASITGATGGTWYTLGIGGTFANATDTNTIYFPSTSDTAAGSVILYMESTGNGICLATRDSLTITFTPLPTVLIKSEDSICSGRAIILNVASSTGAGSWSSSGTGLFLPNTTISALTYLPSAADNIAGVVTLKFVSGNNTGCQPASDTLNVIIKPAPTAAFTSVSACEKDAPVVFTNTSTPAGGIASQIWTFGDFTLPSLQFSTSHTYANCGSKNVTLIVTANNGCTDTNVQSIDVYCLPVANYSAAGVCLNDGTDFTNTSSVNGATIATSNWNFGDSTTSLIPNPSHLFPSSGSFPVTLIVQSSQGCKDTLTQTVSLVANPVAVFTVNDATADISQNIIFTDQTTASIVWSWNFGDASGSTIKIPNHTYTNGGFYNVCLIATDGNGCTDTACHQEIVSTYPIGPSGFSPNGDGQNDVFYAYGGPFKTVEFRIYNNWGELVFESSNQWAGWDGKYKGIDQAIGVYVYTIVGVTEDDTVYSKSGDVTLLR